MIAAMDRVLEIGGYAAGYCGRLFAQSGYDVVRLESPPAPAWTSQEAQNLYLHAGKRRVATVSPETTAEMAAKADVVVVEAESADAVTALGFDDWRTPVKVAITPFGRSGPKRNWRASPHVLLAMGGYTNLMGDPGRAPLSLPGHYVEFQSGGFAFAAANACRLANERNSIDLGMLEVVMALSQFTTVMWHCGRTVRSRHGSDFWSVVPTNLFKCADGWVYINIVPGFWDPFTVFLDMPELLVDDRFATNESRMRNRDALHAIVGEALARREKAEIGQRAEECRIPLGVVQSFDDVLADPHLAVREVWQHIETPRGAVCSPRPSWRIHGAPRPAPKLVEVDSATGAGFRNRVESATRTESAKRTRTPPAGRTTAEGPLRDLRILDLTHVWAGPLATRTLADLGAEVVKIEAPMGRGPREFRGGLPLGGWLGGEPPEQEPWNVNAIFVKLQRNKKSVAVDLKQDAGRAAFLDLVREADVVMENFSARAMPSLGLGYDQLREANPRIIHVSMPGYGQSGPYRDRVAFGPTVEPMSGLTTVMGYGPDEPRNTAMALMDPITAVQATAAVMDAVRYRERTGKGAFVEMSLHEGGVAFCGPWLVEAQLGAERIVRRGNRHPEMAPHGVYRCAGEDAWVAVACRNDDDWQALRGVVEGLPAGDDLEARFTAHDAIDEAIAAWTRRRPKADAAQLLQAAGVPAGPVNITPDMTADPQVRARGFFVPLEPGPTPMPGNPIKMAGIGSDDWTPCPRLGADNRTVLKGWLDYDDSRIAALESAGVLVDKPPK